MKNTFRSMRLAGLFLLAFSVLKGQQSPYQLNTGLDLTIIGGGTLLIIGNHFLHESIDGPTPAEIASFTRSDVWSLDRSATRQWNPRAGDVSNVTLLGSILLPTGLLLSGHVRKDIFKVGVMYVETGMVTGGITNLVKGLSKRHRPTVYNPDAPLEERTKQTAKLSFFSGHVSNSAAFTFLTAKMYSDYYPDSKWKPVVWATAAAIPAATAYLRYRAGKHFLTDVVAGYVVGGLIGYWIPELHKIRSSNLSVTPVIGPGAVLVNLSLDLN